MLRDAHREIKAMSSLAQAVKDERWGEGERALTELRAMLDNLGTALNEKMRSDLNVPDPDHHDRG